MLARRQCLERGRNVEGICGGDDHGIYFRIVQHPLIGLETSLGPMGDGEPLDQIGGDVANRIEICIFAFGYAFEMPGLGDRAASENTDIQTVFRLRSHHYLALLIAGQASSGNA